MGLFSKEIQDLVAGLVQVGAEAEVKLEAMRRCRAVTKAGTRCKAFAVWNAKEQKCAAHLYKHRRTNAEMEANPEPLKKRRSAPTCNCPAYKFPHRRGNGYCRHPDPPLRRHPTPAGKRALGKKRRREWNALRRKFGI
jgi:hypothetical protein